MKKNILGLLLAIGASSLLSAAPFSFEVYFDDASSSSLTFGLGETGEEKPMPPDFVAVKYAYLRGSGNSEDVRNTEDYTMLSKKTYADAKAATWTIDSKADITFRFESKSELPSTATLNIAEVGAVGATAISNGVTFMVKAGRTYEVRYSEDGTSQLAAPAPQSVDFIKGSTSVDVTLAAVSGHELEVVGGSSGIVAYDANGGALASTPSISVSCVENTTYRVENIPADAAYFRFSYKVAGNDGASELDSDAASVLGTAMDMTMTLSDATADPEKNAEFDLAKKQVIVTPSSNDVKVTLNYSIVVDEDVQAPYLLIDMGAQAYDLDDLQAKLNGEAVELALASEDNPYVFKASLAAGTPSFSLTASIDKAKVSDYITFSCGGEGLAEQETARFNVLVSGVSIDFDENDAIALDDANYLLNYRNGKDLLTYSTADATEALAEVAQENITSIDARLDFDDNGKADKNDALMFYNYMTQGGSNNTFITADSLLPDAGEADKPASALEYFRNAVEATGIPQTSTALLTVEAKNYILGVSTGCEVAIYATSDKAVQTTAFLVYLPDMAKADTVQAEAGLDAVSVKDLGNNSVYVSLVGEQGEPSVKENAKTLLATIKFEVDATGLKAGDTMSVAGGYGIVTRINGANIEAIESTNCLKGSIAVIESLPATWDSKKIKNPKSPVVEVSGTKGTTLTATVSAYIDNSEEEDPELKAETITKIHWYASDAAGEKLAEAWSDAKGGWADEDCSQKLGKAVVGEWFVSTAKATVVAKTGQWTSSVTVTTAAYNTLKGADRKAEDTFKINAEVIDSLGGSSTYSWDVVITDKDQLATKPASFVYSVNDGEWVTKLPSVTATDKLVAKAMAKDGKLVVDVPTEDADGDPITYYYAWYKTSKPADEDWKTAEEGGNVLPAHGFGETWKVQVKAFSKPQYAAEQADTKYYTAALTGASVKIANSEPAAAAVEKTIDEDASITIDLLGEGYVTDPDMASDTFTFTVTNQKGKEVNSFTTDFGGQVSIVKATGVLTYVACGTAGTDTFNYTVTDKSKKKATGTVTITLTEMDEPPVFAIKDFFVGKDDYETTYDFTLAPGPDYPEDEQDDSVKAVAVSFVNEEDAAYFDVAPAVTTPVKSDETGLWNSTLTFKVKEDTAYGIVIPCKAVAVDNAGNASSVTFQIVTGVTPWYPVHKAVFADKAVDGVTFKVKEVANGKVGTKILVTVTVAKDEDGSCTILPVNYYLANAKFTGLTAGKTYYFEEYSYTLNAKGKAVIDKKCIADCAYTVEGTCETILDYPAPSPEDIDMTFLKYDVDKKGKITYTYAVSSKLANSVVVTTLNEKSKKVKQYKQNFMTFDEEGQLVQTATMQLSFDNVASVSVQGVNPKGTSTERIFTIDELKAQVVDETRSDIDDTLAAWPTLWTDNAFFPKQGTVSFTEEAEQDIAFTWPVSAVADSYELKVYDAQGNLAAEEATAFTTASAALVPGNYTWIVTAIGEDGSVNSYGNTFSIIDHTDAPVVLDVTTKTGSELILKVTNAAADDTVQVAVTYFDLLQGIWNTATVEQAVNDDGTIVIDDISVVEGSYVTIAFGEDGDSANYVIKKK